MIRAAEFGEGPARFDKFRLACRGREGPATGASFLASGLEFEFGWLSGVFAWGKRLGGGGIDMIPILFL